MDNDVRPTIDRVKESLFNMISPYIMDAIVLDLFSGTGNLGLESISRGAEKTYLVDQSKKSIQVIQENVNILGFEDQCKIMQCDYHVALNQIKEKADIIFLDPPYNKGLIDESISDIMKLELLNEDGIIVAEHSKDEIIQTDYEDLEIIKNKKYGNLTITIYRKQ